MCNDSKTTLKETDDGTILITLDPYDIWNMLSIEQKEAVLDDAGLWHVVKYALEYDLKHGVSSDNFMPSLQRLREMITTDEELVPLMVVACINQLLEDKATAIQEKRESDQAFWQLRNAVYRHFEHLNYDNKPEWAKHIKTGYDVGEDDDFMRFRTKEVHDEVLNAFFEYLQSIK